jgi:voltage-gated potassium channel Kch
MFIEILFSGGVRLTLFAGGLVLVTVIMHAIGFSVLLRALVRTNALSRSGIRPLALILIGLTSWLMMIHAAEISVWGLFYWWQGCLPDAESAFYFSGVTYTTVGYGEVVLPTRWRMFGPIEAMAGTLMSGLSTGLFFAVVSRWMVNWVKSKSKSG